MELREKVHNRMHVIFAAMYYVVYGLLYALSLLPLRVLYILSDAMYGLAYYIIGYRKKVVMQNLEIAFPEKTLEERVRIAKDFYRHLTDSFVETIKFITASKRFFYRHCTFDTSLIKKLYAEGRKCEIQLAHTFNWELANIIVPFDSPYQQLTVYMPLTSKVLDRIFLKLRSRSGAIMLPATRIARAMMPYRNDQYLLALVADQNPGVPSKAYWLEFFGRATPFVTGPEKNARANKTAVVFAKISKPKRGFYKIEFELAELHPELLPEKELTRRYVDFLEQVIREQPSLWLWSHRRWKHDWKEEYGPVMKAGGESKA